jgi:hypothetical protein
MRRSRSQLATVSAVAAVLALAAALLLRPDPIDLVLLILVTAGFGVYRQRWLRPDRAAPSPVRRAPVRPRQSRWPR